MKKSSYHSSFLPFVTLLLFVLTIYSCWQAQPVEITFASGPDDTQIMRELIDKFNEQHKRTIHVNWKETSRITDEVYQELQADFASANPTIDVFGADVIWTGMLGANENVEDLSSRFYQEYDSRDFIPAAMNSVIYDFRIYGVPWFTDASMIYYRKDLLKKHGYLTSPTTWDELKSMARTIKERENIPYGYVFQGDKYEGGVANACEFIWNAGGQITMNNLSVSGNFGDKYIAPSIITVDSRASENGFRMARSLIEEGISPEEVVNFREQEAINSFMNGEAVFMRGWPGSYGQFLRGGIPVQADQVGVCPIPVLESENPSFSCLGGWNLMISAQSSEMKKEAAWRFIQYMVAPQQQRDRALRSGSLPSLKILYQDEKLLSKVPVIRLAKQEIQNARSRPVSPYYTEYSSEIAAIFNQMLKGEILPEYAVFSLQEYLESIQLKDSVAEH